MIQLFAAEKMDILLQQIAESFLPAHAELSKLTWSRSGQTTDRQTTCGLQELITGPTNVPACFRHFILSQAFLNKDYLLINMDIIMYITRFCKFVAR